MLLEIIVCPNLLNSRELILNATSQNAGIINSLTLKFRNFVEVYLDSTYMLNSTRYHNFVNLYLDLFHFSSLFLAFQYFCLR